MSEFVDLQVIFNGFLTLDLSIDQACVLFQQNEQGASSFLTFQFGIIMNDWQLKQTTNLESRAGRLLDLYWKLFGPSRSIAMFPIYDGRLVECFFEEKLRNHLDEFSDDDLIRLGNQYLDKPLQQLTLRVRAQKMVPIANLLLANPADLNKDIVKVKSLVSAYQFAPELNEVLDKIEVELANEGDKFDQAASLKHLRTFFEKLHEHVGRKLQAEKQEMTDNTDLTKCQQAVDYLERHDVLTDRMRGLARALYGVLSEEGVHALKSDREYVRFCRNWVGEYALVLFFELERLLKN